MHAELAPSKREQVFLVRGSASQEIILVYSMFACHHQFKSSLSEGFLDFTNPVENASMIQRA